MRSYDILTLENIQQHRQQLQQYVESHTVLAMGVFFAIYTIFTALCLPAATLLTILSGFLFGIITGAIIVIFAATLGATIIFVLAKGALGKRFEYLLGDRYQRFADAVEKNALSYLLFVRLVPIFPFVLINIAPALLNVKTRIYVLTTFFGMMPATSIYANVGQRLGELESLSGVLSPKMIVAFGLLGLLALSPVLVKFLKKKNILKI